LDGVQPNPPKLLVLVLTLLTFAAQVRGISFSFYRYQQQLVGFTRYSILLLFVVASISIGFWLNIYDPTGAIRWILPG
jgi:hypothetical protein